MKQSEISLATKKSMASALKKLMTVKPISKISVREIVTACDLNRNSFYYHFDDIYDLFKWMLENETIDVVKQCNLITDYHQIINFVLDYVESNQYLIANAYNAVGQAGLKQFFYLDFISCIEGLITQGEQKQGVTLEEDYKHFLCAFYSEAIAGCLLDYVINTQSWNREKLITYLEHLLLRTMPAAIT
ncbi:MAG: TetR/AcrR family transcriptional regulator [Clostridia bacterium]|nr:TetR/AcrR family transcriptional regulator [Clostridia bacterium]